MKFPRLAPMSAAAVSGALFCSAMASSVSAATVFNETFDGDNTTNINGIAPDVRPGSEVWTASTATILRTDGSISATAGASAWLPFNVQSGYIYTLTVTALVQYNSGSAAQFGIGFTADSPLSAAAVNLAASGDYAILQTRRNGSWGFYEGPTNNGTATAGGTGLFAANQSSYEIKLVLDTSAANWTVAGYAGGAQMDLNGASAGLLYTYSSNPTLTGVGLNYGSSTFVFDNFTLDEVAAVPEPSTFAFVAGGAVLGLTMFRRRRG